MNGYKLMANSYRKLQEEGKLEKAEAEKEIRIFEFLETCDEDDICKLVDSSALNDIITAHLKLAVNNTDISKEDKAKVINQLYYIFNEKNAKEVLNS